MREVDIYLYTSSHNPTCADGKYSYELHCDGCSPVKDRGEIRHRTTGHRLAMTCCIEALKRMRRAAVITIHTDCRYLINGHGYIGSWEQNGWTKSGGEPLKNVDLWQKIKELEAPHAIRYQYFIPQK